MWCVVPEPAPMMSRRGFRQSVQPFGRERSLDGPITWPAVRHDVQGGLPCKFSSYSSQYTVLPFRTTESIKKSILAVDRCIAATWIYVTSSEWKAAACLIDARFRNLGVCAWVGTFSVTETQPGEPTNNHAVVARAVWSCRAPTKLAEDWDRTRLDTVDQSHSCKDHTNFHMDLPVQQPTHPLIVLTVAALALTTPEN